MAKEPGFEAEKAHRFYAVECFTQAWNLIDKANRTSEDDETMIQLAMASAWHWRQRPDCTDQNISISYWQISRIYALLGQADQARHYGELCLQFSEAESVADFYNAYAYEALARAEMTAGDRGQMAVFLEKASAVAAGLEDEEEKGMLQSDLDKIRLD